MPDISAQQGQKICAEACLWAGTDYAMIGAKSVKGLQGDCSGSTEEIYTVAGFPFEYQSAAVFPAYALASGLFRKLSSGEKKQDGDILAWPDHMAIYSTFTLGVELPFATTERTNKKTGKHWTDQNDMWTASNRKDTSYGPAVVKWWVQSKGGKDPDVFRWIGPITNP